MLPSLPVMQLAPLLSRTTAWRRCEKAAAVAAATASASALEEREGQEKETKAVKPLRKEYIQLSGALCGSVNQSQCTAYIANRAFLLLRLPIIININ